MKILTIHADFIEFEAKKKAMKMAEEGIKEGKQRVEECLVVFTAFEKVDEGNLPEIVQKYVREIKNVVQQVSAKNIVLYPYAHLSSKLGNPQMAEQVMKDAEKILAEKFHVSRAPFGWYKAFDIKCKGHPLSELSREFSVGEASSQLGEEDQKKVIITSSSITDNDTYKKLIHLLDEHHASYRLINHAPEGRTELVSPMRGNKISQAAKCLIITVRTGKGDPKHILGVVPGDAKIDLEAVKKLFNGTYASFASPEVAEKLAGSVSGTILPFSFNPELELVVDPLLLENNAELYFNAARLDRSLALKTSDYKRITKPRVEHLAKYSEVAETGTIPVKEEVSVSSEEIKNLLKQISKTKLDTSKLKENDHRILGQKLDLFSFNEAAPGSIFWHPKGQIMYMELLNFSREVQKELDYQEVSTPQIYDNKLWKVSGHWGHYKENMFLTEYEGRPAAIKPMNCPGHMLFYRTTVRSYKDLPLRVAEYSPLHRMELSGVLNGLFRVIRFHQDDAHIFIAEEQLEEEAVNVLQIFKLFLEKFGFTYSFTLSLRSEEKKEKYMGSDALWQDAERALERVLQKLNIKFEKMPGEAKFYGPSLDVVIKDSLNREWQCSTLQVDFNLPRRFELEYVGKDGKTHTPIVLHRAVFGSLERFIGVLLEHLDGKLPLWLNPVQIKVLTITDAHLDYAQKVFGELKRVGFRVELDDRTETMGKKIREAQLEKVNYILTVGDKEVEKKTIAVRKRSGEQEFDVHLDTFIVKIKDELRNRKMN